jgi:leader peptidase (prepilin peptidase) / N-methyltransferase
MILMFTFLLLGIGVAISAIDIKQMRIPNALNALLLFSGLSYWVIQSWAALPYQIGNGAFVFSLLWLLRFSYVQLSGKVGLGLGDVKMMGAAAVWISPLSVPLMVFIASFSALVFAFLKGSKSEDGRIPFGPFLAGGMFVTWVLENFA